MASKLYVGWIFSDPRKGRYTDYASPRGEVFRSAKTPTERTHGHLYSAVVGPFRTRAAADIMAAHGWNNPHLQTVADAEAMAKSGGVRSNLGGEYRTIRELQSLVDKANRQMIKRAEIISLNRSNRMRGLPSIPVPPKPDPIYVPIAYEADGTYGGLLQHPDELPEGYIVKWEKYTHW